MVSSYNAPVEDYIPVHIALANAAMAYAINIAGNPPRDAMMTKKDVCRTEPITSAENLARAAECRAPSFDFSFTVYFNNADDLGNSHVRDRS
jgi:hypothetical protein